MNPINPLFTSMKNMCSSVYIFLMKKFIVVFESCLKLLAPLVTIGGLNMIVHVMARGVSGRGCFQNWASMIAQKRQSLRRVRFFQSKSSLINKSNIYSPINIFLIEPC